MNHKFKCHYCKHEWILTRDELIEDPLFWDRGRCPNCKIFIRLTQYQNGAFKIKKYYHTKGGE